MVSVLQTTQIISNVCFITDYVAYASSNKTFESRRISFFFLSGVDAPHVYVRATVLLVPEPGQQHGHNLECPFSGVTKSGRVWRKVPESDARCVRCFHSLSTQNLSRILRQALTYSSDYDRQTRADEKCPSNGVTNYGIVWRKGTGKRGM